MNIKINLTVKRAFKSVLVVFTLLFTLFLSYYNFGNDGLGNPYYTAAVKSMTLNWHNFFFASFDPGGFISVDKPPVALWLQVIFVKVFGFHTWSIMLPEALAALASVAILFYLINRSFGFIAGITAALVLACTPIFIAASHSNNPDALLVLVLILSAWALTIAAENQSLKHLVLSAVLIGIGFNTKMLVAFLIVPIFIALYLFSNTQKFSKTLIHLAAAIVVLCVVSFSWSAAVDLTPANQRPYVGSSSTNSEFNLAFSYNGLNRVFVKMKDSNPGRSAISAVFQKNTNTPPVDANGKINDLPGPLRMANPFLAGQISWFIPLAILGALGALFYIRTLGKKDKRRKYISLGLWSGWAVLMLVFFSYYQSLTHRYYLNIVAPGVAALAGIGFSSLLKLYMLHGLKSFFLPVSLLISVTWQTMILSNYPSWKMLLSPAFEVCLAAALMLILLLIFNRFFQPGFLRFTSLLLSAGTITILLIAPSIWSFITVIGHVPGSDAYAGPGLLGKLPSGTALPDLKTILMDLKFNASDMTIPSYYQAISKYLMQNQGSSIYIAAVPTASMAENIIIQTGKPVMTIGGFNGENPVLTLSEFTSLIQSGVVKYFLTSPNKITGSNSKIISWAINKSRMIDLHVYDIKANYNNSNAKLYLMNAR
jgi:4-amino-4-deoxy-L-arabinose transferase-like glycosyltransferase